jgi:hypothetical protein
LNLMAAYVPFSLQRRLISGVQVPLATLAAIGAVQVFIPWLWRVWPRRLIPHGRYSRRGLAHFVAFVLVVSMVPTNMITLGGGISAALVRVPALFHSADQLDAVEWLASHARQQDVVLSSLPEGNFVPTRAAIHVVLGLDPETVDFDTKSRQVQSFFSGDASDAERRALLEQYQVRFVLYGPNERALGDFDPQTVTYLQQAAEFNTYLVYAVVL